MKLYGTVRVLRGVVLGAATHSPGAAVVTECVSVLSLFQNTTRTLGGVLALQYSGDFKGRMLEIIEEPMRKMLEIECFLLLLLFFAIVISPN